MHALKDTEPHQAHLFSTLHRWVGQAQGPHILQGNGPHLFYSFLVCLLYFLFFVVLKKGSQRPQEPHWVSILQVAEDSVQNHSHCLMAQHVIVHGSLLNGGDFRLEPFHFVLNEFL